MGKAAVSQEEILLRKRARRRLVGAAFLVLVMVIVLPMLLDSEPRPQAESVRVRMPSPLPEAVDPPKAPPVPKPEASTPKEAPPAMADLPPPVAEELPAVQKGAPAEPAAAPPPEVHNASVQTPPAAASAPGGADATLDAVLKPPVVIQLGAYIKAENAQQLKTELAAKKIKAFTEPVTMGQTTRTRVRAGPFDSVAEAEKARDRIARMNLKLGMAPKIVPQGQ